MPRLQDMEFSLSFLSIWLEISSRWTSRANKQSSLKVTTPPNNQKGVTTSPNQEFGGGQTIDLPSKTWTWPCRICRPASERDSLQKFPVSSHGFVSAILHVAAWANQGTAKTSRHKCILFGIYCLGCTSTTSNQKQVVAACIYQG